MPRFARLAPIALAALLAAGAVSCRKQGASAPTLTGDETVLTIGDRTITLREFVKMFDRAKTERGIAGDPQATTALKDELVRETIKQELILRRAREKGLTVSAEEVAAEIAKIRAHYPGDSFREMLAEDYVAYDEWIERQKTRLLVEKCMAEELDDKVTVTDDEVKAYFAAHPEIAVDPEKVHLFQILVSTEEEAKLVKGRLDRGEDFGALAKEKSISPEAVDGGDLGIYTKANIPTGMEIAFTLKPGVPSDVVQSEYGFHIFKVTDHVAAKTLSFDEAKPRIVAKLKSDKIESQFPGWLDSLATGVKVTKNDALLAAVE